MRIEEGVSLKPYNTFGIDVTAGRMVHLDTEEEVKDFISSGHPRKEPLLILGGGSNILFTRDVPGTVLRINTRGIIVERADDQHIHVRVSAGENWDDFVGHCTVNGWYGLENLSMIPGLVGSAPIQNIGAYGVELKDHFNKLEAIHIESGELQTFTRKACRFGYRSSIFKNELKGSWIIIAVTFSLNKNAVFSLSYGGLSDEIEKTGQAVSLESVRQAVKNIRKRKLPDPVDTGNAGSFFKNPEIPASHYFELKNEFPGMVAYKLSNERYKIAAGWLIEDCGWKGKRRGKAGVHDKQSLVLVNHGGATGQEILELSEAVQASVLGRFNISLDREVVVYGSTTK